MIIPAIKNVALLTVVVLLAGCQEPSGTKEERALARAEGRRYKKSRPERSLPPLIEPVTVDDLLRHAFAANAGLEAGYHRWRAALSRITQAGAWDDPQFSFEYLISPARMRGWDETTLGISQTIPTAGKRGLMADAALAEAVKARHEFEQMKFELQMRVISEAANYRYLGQAIALAQEELRLLARAVALVAQRQQSGQEARRDLLEVENERVMAENELKMLQARQPASAASLNALLGREAALALPFPQKEPDREALLADAEFFSLAAKRNPELAAMADEVRGRQDALEYARRAWIPDLTVGYEIMGTVRDSLMGMIMVPLQIPRIKAAIKEAEASLAAAEASRLSVHDNLKARLVAALAMVRDTDRQVRLYQESLVPRTEQILDSLRSSYRAGQAEALEVIRGERAVLAMRLAWYRAQAAYEGALADLEAAVAVDRARWPGRGDPMWSPPVVVE